MILRPPIIILSIPLLLFPLVLCVDDSEALLALKKSFTNAKELDSWKVGTNPCNAKEPWVGVVCFKGIVTSLRLGQMDLSGEVDVAALEKLRGLRSISLTNNAFQGPIPEFNRLGALKTLFLAGNKFEGEIADDYFEKMDSLKKVWLSSNNFTGPIPTSVVELGLLAELHLEDNQFTGMIPNMKQTSLKSLDLSNNKLEGQVPASLAKFNKSFFAGNDGLCGAPLGVACIADGPQTAEAPESDSGPDHQIKQEPGKVNHQDDGSVKFQIAVTMLVAVFLLLLGATIVVVQRRKDEFDVVGRDRPDEHVELHVSPANYPPVQKEPDRSRAAPPPAMGAAPKTNRAQGGKPNGAGELVVVNDERGIFGLPDLMKAAAEVLGNGSLGSAYKAVMTNGVAVVVKRMREMNKVGRDGFDMEMRRLGDLHHRNILTPLAYHYRKEEKLVVYEYVPKGSLLYLLHGDRGSCQAELDWPTRLRIAQGIARGMGFLHTELAAYDLPHGNLKSSNIFLGSNYEPLIADYGFWSLVNSAQATQAMFAYKSPEYVEYRIASPKCDVYCYGIVLLEILTGKFPSQYLNNGTGGTDVVNWVLSAITDGRVHELFDPEIANSQSSLQDMERLLLIGAACVEQNPERRPNMKDVVKKIENIQVESGSQHTSTLKEEYAKLSSSTSPMH